MKRLSAAFTALLLLSISMSGIISPLNAKASSKSKLYTTRSQLMNNEGPKFISFREDLTKLHLMFTPIDLSQDAEIIMTLLGNPSQVVGEAKVVVHAGTVKVTYELAEGVKAEEKNEFFTFFPDIRSVSALDPKKLQDVKLKFGDLYKIDAWGDSKVLLYINTPVSFKTSLKNLEYFSMDDLPYLERTEALLQLMD